MDLDVLTRSAATENLLEGDKKTERQVAVAAECYKTDVVVQVGVMCTSAMCQNKLAGMAEWEAASTAQEQVAELGCPYSLRRMLG